MSYSFVPSMPVESLCPVSNFHWDESHNSGLHSDIQSMICDSAYLVLVWGGDDEKLLRWSCELVDIHTAWL
jgi:hypothetical protein